MVTSQVCNKCGKEKSLDEFCYAKKNRYGRQYHCRQCQRLINQTFYSENKIRERQRARDYRIANPERVKVSVNKWRAEHIEDERRYRIDNAPRIRANSNKWAKSNKDRVRAGYAKRRALLKKCMPKWADSVKILELFKKAKQLSEETGVVYEVDHIIPLQSKSVCGLHWEGNLQVIPRDENRTKFNSRWPDDMLAYKDFSERSIRRIRLNDY